jgi:hypothetical protein
MARTEASGTRLTLTRLLSATGSGCSTSPDDLWVTTATVPMIAHYDMYHDKTTRTVSSLLMLWDGQQLIDTSAGYADNDALVAQLLGFRPARHAPLTAGGTLYAPAAGVFAPDEDDEAADDEDEDG